MSDPTDIVEYLRKNAVFNYRDTYLKAADEIERLRKERDDLNRRVEELEDDKFQAGRGGLWQRFCEEDEYADE